MSKESLKTVFVYGTLKPGGRNNHIVKNSIYLGIGFSEPGWELYSHEAFPAAVPTKEFTGIKGVLFQVNQEVFNRLDQLEGYPRLYDRKEILTLSYAGTERKAFIYFMKEKPESMRKMKISRYPPFYFWNADITSYEESSQGDK